MSQADQIRKYVLDQIIEPARRQSRSLVQVHAAEVHAAMKLENRFPAVCSALDADKFLGEARVTLVRRSGPKHGSTAEWVFGL